MTFFFSVPFLNFYFGFICSSPSPSNFYISFSSLSSFLLFLFSFFLKKIERFFFKGWKILKLNINVVRQINLIKNENYRSSVVKFPQPRDMSYIYHLRKKNTKASPSLLSRRRRRRLLHRRRRLASPAKTWPHLSLSHSTRHATRRLLLCYSAICERVSFCPLFSVLEILG